MNRISTAIASARTAARRLVRREHDGQAEADLMNRALEVLNGQREPTPGDEREAAEVEKSLAAMYAADKRAFFEAEEGSVYMTRAAWDADRRQEQEDWRAAEREAAQRAADHAGGKELIRQASAAAESWDEPLPDYEATS